jgi:1-acyl-sn-glycerol-3-phosphate acyltransferase
MIPQNSSGEKASIYRLQKRMVVDFAWDVLRLRPRSFSTDAKRAVARLHPGLEILGAEHVPQSEPCLVVCNHYSRPGFGAWWLALAIAAAVATLRAPRADPEIHWVMTAAWTFPDSRWRRRVLMPISRWAFARVARVYDFVPMPPMPPHPDEVEARARSVLRTVRLARRLAPNGGMIGLAPEGRDVTEGLAEPPAGVGTFIALLVEAGLPVLPTGFEEYGGRLCVSFGPLLVPVIPQDRARRDREVAQEIMAAIARQLPHVVGSEQVRRED